MRKVTLLALFSLTVASFAHADELTPQALGKLWLRSIELETKKDYPKALSEMDAFSQNGGDPFLSALRVAWLKYSAGEYQEAEKNYRKAVLLAPSSVNALLGVLNSVRAQRSDAKQTAAAMAVLAVDPGNYHANLALAFQSFSKKKYSEALAAYRRLLALYPEDNDARSGAAWSLLYLGEKHAAKEQFSRLLSMSPNYPGAGSGYRQTLEP